MTLSEEVQAKRNAMRGLFTKRELENPITRASVIQRYINLGLYERYPFGIPKNLIRLDRNYWKQ